IPGSGWSFNKTGVKTIKYNKGSTAELKINRAIIQKGNVKQIAYYWFLQRGRVLTNAVQLKIYTFWDSLTMQRTDGALVRLITPIRKNENVADAEKRLDNFVRQIAPILNEYIPS
ncbi:MAG: EpsI family protein, partial [Deltaproteobacteria bacterium]|nr:EpsI family protein [Deltaproteobacteria bacterium]